MLPSPPFPFAYQPSLLSEFECAYWSDRMDRIISSSGVSAAVGTSDRSELDPKSRVSSVAWLDPRQDLPSLRIFSLLVGFAYMTAATRLSHYRLALTPSLANIQLTRYGPDGFYGSHRDDSAPHPPRRAISVVLLIAPALSGGEFAFHDFSLDDTIRATLLRPGTALAFPSHLFHEVRPVHSGVRDSMVLWLPGGSSPGPPHPDLVARRAPGIEQGRDRPRPRR